MDHVANLEGVQRVLKASENAGFFGTRVCKVESVWFRAPLVAWLFVWLLGPMLAFKVPSKKEEKLSNKGIMKYCNIGFDNKLTQKT